MSSNQPISGSSASKDTTPKQEEVKKSPLKKVGNAEGNDGPSFAPTPTTKPGASSRLSGLFRSKPKPQPEEEAPKLMYGIEEHEKELFPEEFEETKHVKSKSKSKNTSDDTGSIKSNKSTKSSKSLASVKSAISTAGMKLKQGAEYLAESEAAEFLKDMGADFHAMGVAAFGSSKEEGIPGYNPDIKVKTSPFSDSSFSLPDYESSSTKAYYKPKPRSSLSSAEKAEEISSLELKEKYLNIEIKDTEEKIQQETTRVQKLIESINSLQERLSEAKYFQVGNSIMLKIMQLNQQLTDRKIERSQHKLKLMLLLNDKKELLKERERVEYSHEYMTKILGDK